MKTNRLILRKVRKNKKQSAAKARKPSALAGSNSSAPDTALNGQRSFEH